MGTDIDLADLTANAEAATPGPWRAESAGGGLASVLAPPLSPFRPSDWLVAERLLGPDAAYIAAMGPDVAKALIARLERAEAIIADEGTVTEIIMRFFERDGDEWHGNALAAEIVNSMQERLAAYQKGTTTDGR